MLIEILGRNIEIGAYVDSKTLFQGVAEDGKSFEKRLQIDIFGLIESYNNGELAKLHWILGHLNPTHGLIKFTRNPTNS